MEVFKGLMVRRFLWLERRKLSSIAPKKICINELQMRVYLAASISIKEGVRL